MNCFSLVHLFWIPVVKPFPQVQHTSILIFYSQTLHLTSTQSPFLLPGSQPCLEFRPASIPSSTPSLVSYLAPHLTPFLTPCSVLIFSVPPPLDCCLPFSALSCLGSRTLLPSCLLFFVHSIPIVQRENHSTLIAPNLSSVFPCWSIYQMVPFALTGFSLWPLLS